jgi:PKD repeat protein
VKATSQNATYVFTSPGTYSVRLRVRNQFGQDDEVKAALITVNSPSSTGQKTNLDIQLSGPLQVAKSERFTISVLISNAGYLTATNVIRTISIEDAGNDTPVASGLPTGSTSARVGKSTVITLPLIVTLITGGAVTGAFSITAPGSTGDIKITAVVQSPEQDSAVSDNVTELSIKVK